LVTPGTSAIAEKLATENPQELKGTPEIARMPASVWMQATAVRSNNSNVSKKQH
jgi:hypothetical protein